MRAFDTEPRVEVPCQDCGSRVTLTVNWYRRKARDGSPVRCDICRLLVRADPDEDAYWFWLERYGAARNGLTAAQHVETYGLPPGLDRLISLVTTGEAYV